MVLVSKTDIAPRGSSICPELEALHILTWWIPAIRQFEGQVLIL
jgi:hypothetical protein